MKGKKSEKTENQRGGFIIAAEMNLIATTLVAGLMVGFVSIRDAMIGELHDLAESFGAVSQSYAFPGASGRDGQAGTAGSSFQDGRDAGDGVTYSVSVAPKSES